VRRSNRARLLGPGTSVISFRSCGMSMSTSVRPSRRPVRPCAGPERPPRLYGMAYGPGQESLRRRVVSPFRTIRA
jgi:hypothetical protein